MAYDICIRNGTIIPLAEAHVSVASVEVAYGFAVYENIRVVRGRPLFVAHHLARLMASATIIGLSHCFAPEEIAVWITTLIERSQADALNLKILLYGGKTDAEATLFILPLQPLFPDKALYRTGAHAITVHAERPFPHAKTLAMLPSYLAYRQAKAAKAYDALLVDHAGCITEGTRTNFFVLRGRTIIGAPKEKVLPGVTMLHMLAAATRKGFRIEEGDLRIDDLSTIDGAMLTSTSSKIMPLASIDTIALTIPPALRELMEGFGDIVEDELAREA